MVCILFKVSSNIIYYATLIVERGRKHRKQFVSQLIACKKAVIKNNHINIYKPQMYIFTFCQKSN